jgi:hypothetical protein
VPASRSHAARYFAGIVNGDNFGDRTFHGEQHYVPRIVRDQGVRFATDSPVEGLDSNPRFRARGAYDFETSSIASGPFPIGIGAQLLGSLPIEFVKAPALYLGIALNAPSAWAAAKRDAPKVAEQLWTFPTPKGPKGPAYLRSLPLLGHLEFLPPTNQRRRACYFTFRLATRLAS